MSTARPKCDQPSKGETRRHKSRSRESQREAGRRTESPSYQESRKHEEPEKDDTRRHKSRSPERQREGPRTQSPSQDDRRKHEQRGKDDTRRHISRSPERQREGSRRIQSPSESGICEKFHSSHQDHPLERVRLESMYTCNGCKMDGMGPRYRCESCNFDLHEQCMSARPSKTFQGYNCKFSQKPPDNKRTFCDACGLQAKGFVFHCAQSEMDFHPLCAELPSEFHCPDITFKLQRRAPSNCRWCNKKTVKGTDEEVPGWAYASLNGPVFHVYCVLELAMHMRNWTANSGEDLGAALTAMSCKPESDRPGGGSGSKWPEKICTTLLKSAASALLGHLGLVAIDAFPW